jgi:carboxypeptidase D
MTTFTPRRFSRYSLLLVLLLLRSRSLESRRIAPKLENRDETTTTSKIEEENGASPQKLRRVRSTERQDVSVKTPLSPDEHLVNSLPLLTGFPTKHWAGLLPASVEPGNYLFYWLFEPDFSQTPSGLDVTSVPLVIWLNGGPGCSSMDGLFFENGPFRFVRNEVGDWSLQPSTTSWHLAPAYVLYIDQPVGTGLSFSTTKQFPGNDEQVNQHFYSFLLQFLQLHGDKFLTAGQGEGDWIMNRPLYFTGESHAGHYIPSMMAYIIKHNHVEHDSTITVRLDGAAIGNGWIDPRYQYAAAHAAYGHAIIDQTQVAALDRLELQCRLELQQQNYQAAICHRLLDDIVNQSTGARGNFIVSQYDARQWESKEGPRQFPPGYQVVEHYLGGWESKKGKPPMSPDYSYQAVLEAIHATASQQAGQRYLECTDPPYLALAHQDGLGVVDEVTQLLEYNQKIRLLFYNGVYDLICNHVGNEVLLEKLAWTHQQDYKAAPRFAWTAPSKMVESNGAAPPPISGYVKEYDNLIFLKVMDSGHMVPMDVPEVALDMIRTFLFQGSFQQSIQNLEQDPNGSMMGGACS